jgi:restriction endonuclease S subunit
MSFPNYPTYKNSGICEVEFLPAHWCAKSLKHIARIDSCGCYGIDSETNGPFSAIPVATTAQINEEGRFDVSEMPIRKFTEAEVERYSCMDGDILVVKSSGSATNIISGKAGLVEKETPRFIFSNFLMRICPRKEIADPRFVYALLRSQLTRQRVEQMCSTTTYPNLKVNEYISALLPMPPKEEQELIADFLDAETSKIDALVAEQRRLIELLKEKRQAVISHAVTKGLNPHVKMKPSGIDWLGDVPEHWEVVRLKKVASLIDGDRGPEYPSESDFVDSGIPFLSSKNIVGFRFINSELKFITSEKFNALSRGKIRHNDLAITVRGTIGHVGLFDSTLFGYDSAFINAQMMILRPFAISPYLLHAITESVHWQKQLELASYGAAQKQLSNAVLSNVVIVLPPPNEIPELLKSLEAKLDELTTLVAEAETSVNILQERRTALISAAVTGKIDLRDFVPKDASA